MSSFLKLVATVAPAGFGFDSVFHIFNNFVELPVWGVPVTVFGAAATGAGLSLFFGEPVDSRRALWGQISAACIFGTALAVLVADGMNLQWASDHMSMFALACAALIRWFLQPAIDRGKALIRDFKLNFKVVKSDPTPPESNPDSPKGEGP